MKSQVNETQNIDGIRLGVAAAGIRYTDRDDVVVIELGQAATTAATFTRNRFAAAPVTVARDHLAKSAGIRYLLINAGNANAGTGTRGMQDAQASCSYLAEQAGTDSSAVLPFSTGVIGEHLPLDKLCQGIDQALNDLSEHNWARAASAIMTTDTLPKLVSHAFTLNGKTCHITGMAKGSGMIHPDMATLLAFVATDATVPDKVLQQALLTAVDDSFNSITVDGDTSTNDACVAIATGKGPVQISDDEQEQQVITAKITLVCQQLAELIIKDAEGATKLARIRVTGGRNREECKTIGYTVALSPLVKTALFGSDPNWGRILAAVGRAPVDTFDLGKVNIFLDDICIVSNGEPDQWYTEEDGAQVMQRNELTVKIDMGMGDAEAEILTSDLSHDYVSINADYRS